MPSLTVIPELGHPRRVDALSDEEAALTFEVPGGVPVLDAAVGHGVGIATLCGGAMHCRTCQILVVGPEAGLSRKGVREADVLRSIGASPDARLACQARVVDDVTVRVPPPQDMVR